jgi:hypothetical protein
VSYGPAEEFRQITHVIAKHAAALNYRAKYVTCITLLREPLGRNCAQLVQDVGRFSVLPGGAVGIRDVQPVSWYARETGKSRPMICAPTDRVMPREPWRRPSRLLRQVGREAVWTQPVRECLAIGAHT